MYFIGILGLSLPAAAAVFRKAAETHTQSQNTRPAAFLPAPAGFLPAGMKMK